jgi:hypothetical protein
MIVLAITDMVFKLDGYFWPLQLQDKNPRKAIARQQCAWHRLVVVIYATLETTEVTFW